MAGAATSQLPRNESHGRAAHKVGGLVIARQQPETVGGIVLLTLQDEQDMLTAIVPKALYSRERLLVRTVQLLLIEGVLERPPKDHGDVNLVAETVTPLTDQDGRLPDNVEQLVGKNVNQELDGEDGEEELAGTGTDGFPAVAPPVPSFAQGGGGDSELDGSSVTGGETIQVRLMPWGRIDEVGGQSRPRLEPSSQLRLKLGGNSECGDLSGGGRHRPGYPAILHSFPDPAAFNWIAGLESQGRCDAGIGVGYRPE
jgi:hypothetical protein